MTGFKSAKKEHTFERSDNMASIVKRGKNYHVRVSWRDKSGVLKQKSKGGFKTKNEARQYAVELEQQLFTGVNIKQKKIPFSEDFANWYEVYKQPTSKHSTQQRYEVAIRQINEYFQDIAIQDITRHDYQVFLNQYGTNRSKNTVRIMHSMIKACVSSAMYDEIIRKNFTENIQLVFDPARTRKIDYLSLDELKRLTDLCLNGRQKRYTSRYMILTAIMTGMRIGEIMALTWDDIDYQRQTITVNKTWDYQSGGGFKATKNDSSNRTVNVTQQLLDWLAELKENNSNMVFENARGQIPTSAAANNTLRTLLKQAEIKKPSFHFHSLRHTHVAYLLSKGIDIFVISKRLGHSNLSTTTDTYAYLIHEYQQTQISEIKKNLALLAE